MELSEPVDEERVLVLTPFGRDASLTANLLERQGIASHVCFGVDELVLELSRGAGAAVVAEEAFSPATVARVASALAQQPAWSDFPFVVFTARDVSARQNLQALEVLTTLGNVTALERPVHSATLISASQAALRARRRQYQSRQALEQREADLRHRDRFLAMLGHELRNPLSAIQHAAEMLTRDQPGDPRRGRPVSVIERQMRHLTRLVDDLLEVSRVTSGKIVLQSQTVDLVPVVQAAAEAFTTTAPHDRPELRLDLPAEGVLVWADPVRLHQMVDNLLTNAFKYTPPGGRVTIRLANEPGWAVVRVSDNGVGISAEVLPTVFEPFAQADRTLDRAQGGMGLGLTVVRALAELHGGEVAAASDGPGRGATFTIRLPLGMVEEDARPLPVKPPVGLSSFRSRHVLLVEDAEDIREALFELLTGLGHQVEVAADGEQGVECALTTRPEVAVIDIGLPRIDGYEVARRLRAALGHKTFLIALTGYGQPEDVARARAAGFDQHLRKPMRLDQIARVVSAAGDEPGQQEGVDRHHQRNQTSEHDAVLEDGPEDGGLVSHLARRGC
jgi:signal transduction histidine kinase/CheY-like chemotaxis protein